MATPKTIAILQSNYIPWKGYFDIIAAVDEFLIFDEVQFTRRDWRNRNKIVQAGKLHWLTIPVASKGAFDAAINEIIIADRNWVHKHWSSIRHAYGKAPYFKELSPVIEGAYNQASDLVRLTDINELLLRILSQVLELETAFARTEKITRQTSDPTGRLVEICLSRGATRYVSGPAAKAYIEHDQFAAANIELLYANYNGYPTYDQGMEPFEHGVSMLDILFRFGSRARSHLKTVSRNAPFLEPACI